MSYHYLFAINHPVLAQFADNPELPEALGRAVASFRSPAGLAWEPEPIPATDVPLLNRLALFEYDAHTAAFRAEGFQFDLLPWKTFCEMDRDAVRQYAQSPSDTPPDPQRILKSATQAVQTDPIRQAIGAELKSREAPSSSNDVTASIYTVREEVADLIRRQPGIASAFGKALLEAALSPVAGFVQVAGINYNPAFRKRLIVRANAPVLCFWVFNGLQVVEDFDERHWRTLEKKRFIKPKEVDC